LKQTWLDQLFNSSEKRLARALLLLARYGKEGQPETIIGKISQETLAELVGTTRSRVNVFMNVGLQVINLREAPRQIFPQNDIHATAGRGSLPGVRCRTVSL
jgi:hypothetical protein